MTAGPPPRPVPFTDADRREIARLSEEVARLRAGGVRRRGRGRWVVAVALMLVSVAVGMASVTAVVVRNQVLDTDRYVANVAPLAHDPVVQDAVATRLSTEVLSRVDLEALARQATGWLRQQGAPSEVEALVAPAVRGAESFVRSQVRRLVGTAQFAEIWEAANRAAHRSLVAVLTGATAGPVTSAGDTVSVDLGALLESVKQLLVDAGFALAARIPEVSVQFTVLQSPELPRIRTAVRWLDLAASWLPWVALALLLAAVAAAPNRRRGTVVAGLVAGIGLLLSAAALAAVRDYHLGHLPPAVRSPEAVAHVARALLGGIREVATVLVAVALAAAACAYLSGPGRVAAGLRRAVARGLDAAGRWVRRSGVPLGPVPAFLARHRGAAVAVTVVAGAFVLVWQPSVQAVGWLALGIAAVVAVVEALARSAPPPGPPVPAG
ncbi:MAG TPA: hypothetical protein VFY17_09785 [Pilimelia sp.]|nr:hypothetical protein [Pilimelia sp.]